MHNGNGTTALSVRPEVGAQLEAVLIQGDLAKLTPAERVTYYKAVCDSVGLNPLTKPFDYITLNGKLVLYAKKDATDQLRAQHNISITALERQTIEGVYVVTAHAQTPQGRQDTSTGAVNIKGLQGDNLANALMKAETKAKRRVTLSICGLGLLDETELETIPNAYPQNTPQAPVRSHKPDDAPAVKYVNVEQLRTPQDADDDFDQVPFPQQHPNAVTEKQVKAIYAIGRAAKRLSEEQTDARCFEIFGAHVTELTKAEASQLIDMLKGEAA